MGGRLQTSDHHFVVDRPVVEVPAGTLGENDIEELPAGGHRTAECSAVRLPRSFVRPVRD